MFLLAGKGILTVALFLASTFYPCLFSDRLYTHPRPFPHKVRLPAPSTTAQPPARAADPSESRRSRGLPSHRAAAAAAAALPACGARSADKKRKRRANNPAMANGARRQSAAALATDPASRRLSLSAARRATEVQKLPVGSVSLSLRCAGSSRRRRLDLVPVTSELSSIQVGCRPVRPRGCMTSDGARQGRG